MEPLPTGLRGPITKEITVETFLTIAIYWDITMWIIGALVVTGALVFAAMAIYHELFKGWGKTVANDFLFHLWLYQAMRAWEREGNPRPDGSPMISERDKLTRCARELIAFAEEHGYVLTIETEPKAFMPLAMGNSQMVFEVREARERYQKGGK